MMLTESIAVAVQPGDSKKLPNSNLKDAGVIIHQIHPESSLRQVFKKSSTTIGGLAISKTHIFAVQADRAAVNVYNREKGNQEAQVFFPDKVTSIAIQDEETANFAVLGMANGGLMIWEVLTGRSIITNRFHTQPITTVKLHRHSNLILTGSSDTNVHVWDLAHLVAFTNHSEQVQGSPLRTFGQHRAAIADIVISSGRAFSVAAISVSKDGTCHIWDPTTSQLSRTILLNTIPTSIALDPADRVLYIGSEDGALSSVNFLKTFAPLFKKSDNGISESKIQEQGSPFARLPEGVGAVNCLAVSYDSTVVLSGHSDGKVYAWDVSKRKLRQVVVDIGQPITCLQHLTPEGIRQYVSSNITAPAIVKPKPVETFATGGNHGTSGIPSNYSISAQLIGKHSRSMTESSMKGHEYETRVRNPGFFLEGPFHPSLLDEGLNELSESVTSNATTLANDEPVMDKSSQLPADNSGHDNLTAHDIAQNLSSQSRIRLLEKALAQTRQDLDEANLSLARSVERRSMRQERFEEAADDVHKQYYIEIRNGVPPKEASRKMDAKMEELYNNRQAQIDEEEMEVVVNEVRSARYGKWDASEKL
ncbi:putative ribosomal assembly complex component [Phaeomoniella chlamydospora]|uniref:Pre-rRNA-processing protein IPI3 n=1 Tax=Phaeomoniella chlamydospora TaxID=158046 RepID=A0A0G2GCD6_PHACM|nr:putative ribosomal assembly complex component [Phaeomoniella chlamydospora]